MRLGRIVFILFAIYLIFLGGSAYYTLIFPIRQLHHTLMTIVLATWLVMRLRRGGFPKTPLNWPIAAAVVVWIISAAASVDPRMAFENLWFVLIHILFFYILADLFQRGRQHLVMETTFMIGAIVVILTGMELASWYFGLGILPNMQIGWIDVIGKGIIFPLKPLRVSLAMNISTLLAGFTAPLVIISAVWGLTARKQSFRRILWLLAGSLLIVLILTFSRGGLLSILTAIGTIGILQVSQTKKVNARIPPRILLGVGVFIGAIFVSGFVIYSITQARRNDTGDAGRLDMWKSAIAITADYPIAGVGPGIFGREFRTYRDPTIVQDKLASAHNAYLNTAAENGVAGIVVSIWLGFAFISAWYKNWRTTQSPEWRLRLAGAFGALLGMGVHSLVDVFTITPIVLLICGLAAYCITPTAMIYEGHRNLTNHSLKRKAPVYGALVAVIAYGIWLFQLDRAQSLYLDSFSESGEAAISHAAEAAALDNGLYLYPLQVAYLKAQGGSETEAIDAYKAALALEPTWDVGWINLAGLSLRQGQTTEAITYLDRARKINVHNSASLQWAKLQEVSGFETETAIVEAYVNAIEAGVTLPLSTFWYETPLRQKAVQRYLEDQPIDIQYRVLSVHDPKQAAALVQANPAEAAAWWVMGEHSLKVSGNIESARDAFDEAIRLSPVTGDYYVSRARATYKNDPKASLEDLNMAYLLGTTNEYPNALRAELASSPDERESFLAQTLPPKPVLQEFAAVLYGRPAIFQIDTDMQNIGPGKAAMQAWYTLAQERVERGNIEGAIRVYQAIIEYAPEETEARDILVALSIS